MPMPLWWGHINKRFFNPRAVDNTKWAVVTHVGRSTGRVFRTPLGAHEIDNSFVFVLVYGSRSDWAQNILKAGSASLDMDNETIELVSPRLISREEASVLLDGIAKRAPSWLKVDEYLRMDVAGRKPIQDQGGKDATRRVRGV